MRARCSRESSWISAFDSGARVSKYYLAEAVIFNGEVYIFNVHVSSSMCMSFLVIKIFGIFVVVYETLFYFNIYHINDASFRERRIHR